jgi:hypothetical protein
MSQGFLVFAHDNEQIEYGLLALGQAKRIRTFLDKPVSIVLDTKTKNNLDEKYQGWQDHFDKIIDSELLSSQTKRYGDVNNQLTFHNLDRTDAYTLTPYDETIVIDTDVLIQSSQLNKIWNNSEDLLVCEHCTDIYGNKTHEFTWLSNRSIKFYWATIFYFKKTEYTKLFFNHCQWVKERYAWLAYIYEIPTKPMRNDFVWSIALHDLGHPAPTIPFNLMYSTYDDQVIDSSPNAVKMLSENKLCKITQDLHMFNKYDLMGIIRKDMA